MSNQKKKRSSLEVATERAELLTKRLQIKQLEAALSYHTAADRGRRNKDNRAIVATADQAIIPDAAVVTARARLMVANTALGKAASRAHKRNVVGPGITPIPAAKNRDGTELSDLNLLVGKLFAKWSREFRYCDVEQRRTFPEFQRLIANEEFVAGEAFLVWSYVPNLTADGRIDLTKPVGLRLQAFEQEQLDAGRASFEGREVRGGVEVDEDGAAVAYHFRPQRGTSSVRVVAERVMHFFSAERVMQSRGMSHFAPVAGDIRDISSAKDANLWRMRMEACIGFIIKKAQASGPGSAFTLPRKPEDPGTTASGMRTTDFVPGMVPELQPGEDIEPFLPSTPGILYDSFNRNVTRGVGAGLGQSYGMLTRENDANYSAARQDMLEDGREIDPVQDSLIAHVITPAYELFYRFAIAEGRLDAYLELSEFLEDPDRFLEAENVTPARPWIDPEKEMNAYEKGLKLRLITRKGIIGQSGDRFQHTMRQIKGERDEAKALDITFPEDAEITAQTAPQLAAPSDDSDKSSDDDSTPNSDSADLAAGGAPNYRPTTDAVMNCGTCRYFFSQKCNAYDFPATASSVCDSWEAPPIRPSIRGGKMIDMPIPDGQRGIDRDFQPAASTAPLL